MVDVVMCHRFVGVCFIMTKCNVCFPLLSSSKEIKKSPHKVFTAFATVIAAKGIRTEYQAILHGLIPREYNISLE